MQTISFKDLIIGYSTGTELPEFPKMSGSVIQSELTVLLGRNGIGKSTLLRTLTGLQPHSGGELLLCGKPIESYTLTQRANLLGFVSTERIRPANLSVFNLVGLGRYNYTNWLGKLTNKDRKAVQEAIEMAGISHLALKNINQLSDGELQRAMIARILAQDTAIIILDEPTAFLDIPNKYEIIRLLRRLAHQQGKSILLSTHDLDMAISLADKLWIMSETGLNEGAPEDFAINQLYSSLFLGSDLKFNYSTGELVFNDISEKEFSLRCNNTQIEFWICRAMSRLGYKLTEFADFSLEIVCSDNSIERIVAQKKGKMKTYHSIYQLTYDMRKL